MFKSTLFKYISTFCIIILVSFCLITFLFTAIFRSYMRNDKDSVLRESTNILVGAISDAKVTDLKTFIRSKQPFSMVAAMLRLEDDMDVIFTDPEGNILLSSVGLNDDFAFAVYGDLGTVPLSIFTNYEENDKTYLLSESTLNNLLLEKNRVFGDEIMVDDVIVGYVFSLRSTVIEDSVIGLVRRASYSCSAWVLLAALIAVYFITDRMMNPLREITKATKAYAKGDMSTRVKVKGDDEVAKLAIAFNDMADNIQKTEKMRNSFLANVSHDLRTPMTTISGFIDNINSGAIPPEKQGYYLGVISAEVHRLSRLVSELLDIARLESGERKYNFSNFDIAEEARIILISFEQKIGEKNLDVEFISDDSVYVKADKDAIYQVLYNLCHNAVKFSKEGGKFSITITQGENKKVTVAVYDEGAVIPEEDIPFIFDRFYKTDKSRGLDKNGVGLGLYISKTIIDAHNETMYVESKEGRGTSFVFTLPMGEECKRG